MAVGPPPVPQLQRPDVSLIPTQSAGLQAQQDYLGQQIKGLPGVYNPQRQRQAASSARGMTDQGYFERANPSVTGTAADGSQSWGLGTQFEGRAFRNQRRGDQAGVASSGVRGSTATNNQMEQATGDLVNAAQRQQRAYDDEQFKSLQSQGQQATQLGGQQRQVIGEQADFGAQGLRQRADVMRDYEDQQSQLDYQGALTQSQYDRENAAQAEGNRQWAAGMAENTRQFDLNYAQNAGQFAYQMATQNLPS